MKRILKLCIAVLFLQPSFVGMAQTPSSEAYRFTFQPSRSDEFNSTGLNTSFWYDKEGVIGRDGTGNVAGANGPYCSTPTQYSNNTVYTYFTWDNWTGNNCFCCCNGSADCPIAAGGPYYKNMSFQQTTWDANPTNKSLALHLRRENTPYNCVRENYYGEEYNLCNPKDGEYTGKVIQTHLKYYYGFFEIKAKMPNLTNSMCKWAGQQFWLFPSAVYQNNGPAWLTNTNYYNELDVFENNGCDNNHVPGTVHLWKKGVDSAYTHGASNYEESLDYSISLYDNSVHTYGMNWQPNFVEFYVDGKPLGKYTHVIKNPNLTQSYPVTYLRPMNVLLETFFTNAKGSIAPNPGSDYGFEVDYFRYYKMNPVLKPLLESSNVLSMSASSSNILEEDYSWSVLSGPAVITSFQNNSPSLWTFNAASINLGLGLSKIRVTATTGVTRIDPIFNPSATGTTTFLAYSNNGGCWNITSSNIDPTINCYYAKCITSSLPIIAPYPAGVNSLQFLAADYVLLQDGFQTDVNSNFEAIAP